MGNLDSKELSDALLETEDTEHEDSMAEGKPNIVALANRNNVSYEEMKDCLLNIVKHRHLFKQSLDETDRHNLPTFASFKVTVQENKPINSSAPTSIISSFQIDGSTNQHEDSSLNNNTNRNNLFALSGTIESVASVSSLQPGDHIFRRDEIEDNNSKFPFEHHGIVIHVSRRAASAFPVAFVAHLPFHQNWSEMYISVSSLHCFVAKPNSANQKENEESTVKNLFVTRYSNMSDPDDDAQRRRQNALTQATSFVGFQTSNTKSQYNSLNVQFSASLFNCEDLCHFWSTGSAFSIQRARMLLASKRMTSLVLDSNFSQSNISSHPLRLALITPMHDIVKSPTEESTVASEDLCSTICASASISPVSSVCAKSQLELVVQEASQLRFLWQPKLAKIFEKI